MTMRSSGLALAWWPLPLLLLQCLALNLSAALSWPTWALVVCAGLKLREAKTPLDRRLVALLQLLSLGLLAAQLQGLLASLLQLLALLTALGALLAHEFGGAFSPRLLLLRSAQLLLAALPLALVLFLFLPRIPPLWTTDLGPSQGAVSGLSPDLDPLGLAVLARSHAPAARLTLGPDRSPPTDGYWRVLVHEQFDGRRWRHRDPPSRSGGNLSRRVGPGGTPQWWSVEPSATRAVPWDGSARPTAERQWISPEGELLLPVASRQRRSYRLMADAERTPSLSWQQRPPLPVERTVPARSLPRLQRLAAAWRALPKDQDRLKAAEQWFRSQPFQYSLQPGPSTDLDAFLFDRQVGFCGHYAGALAALMRAADVPARVVSGYQGGRLEQPLSGASYLDLRQSDAHAWTEVWLQGRGWQRVDPTTWIGSGGAAQVSRRRAWAADQARLPALVWLQREWWALDLAWTRWWLGFDQATQSAWLRQVFGEQIRWLGLAIVAAAALAIALGLGLWHALRRDGGHDPLARSLLVLRGLGITALPGESFPMLCRRAARVHPGQAASLLAMADLQQQLAHAPITRPERRRCQRSWARLRRQLVRASR
ncbi:transglutaminaseTgpA domain-containing protein [Parasynechococcus sp.]|uniref:transglutaminase family protein n=1 Tax=Parasynechococcus sp. TaxID=3101203 RepID=UPI0037039910